MNKWKQKKTENNFKAQQLMGKVIREIFQNPATKNTNNSLNWNGRLQRNLPIPHPLKKYFPD